ncbi:GatA Asp-tRNAAsn/Glu-tRNAGln amidotransferase A subunit and related amidases [Rhabdaerophilaceae bacterium]
MTHLTELDAFELTLRYGDGSLSPVEVAHAAIARREAHERTINAFCWHDDAAALASAEASEARWRSGSPIGSVDGVPVTIKDNLMVKGWPIRRGSIVSSPAVAEEDSPVAARLREAGAVILGKTTMPEYGWKGTSDSPFSGITRNPWNNAMTTGGSSAGAAATGALGVGCLHFGTDGAGSVRIPAAFTGLVGFKPTFGRVPAWPASTMGVLAHIGPLTRSVREAALAMNIIARPDHRDMMASLADATNYLAGVDGGVKGLRIAYSPKLGLDVAVDPDVAELAEHAALCLEGLGARVDRVDPGFPDPIEPLMVLWRAGAALALRPVSAEDRARMDPGLVGIAQQGEKLSASDYIDALLYQRNALAMTMARFHQRYDLLLTPTMPLPAFEAGRLTPAHGGYGDIWTNWSPFTYPFNLTQQPAISIPSGLTRMGLPAGLQIIGAFGADCLVLKAAAAFEAASPFARLS